MMVFGPNPWQQTSWDARAAGNFACGGAGAGLIVFSVLAGAQGQALAALILAGLALVALGLACVALEIGRPLRALKVFRNPRTSWMSREAIAATLLFPVGMAAMSGVQACAWVAAGLALGFLYCQSRMLQSAKGIPAWREPLLSPLIVATGLAEGGGLFMLGTPWHGLATLPLVTAFGVLVIARLLTWLAYRRRLKGATARGAGAALDRAGRVLRIAGTLMPLTIALAIGAGAIPDGGIPAFVALAGLLTVATGSWLKFVLVTRAGFNQGFALAHLPVRGARP